MTASRTYPTPRRTAGRPQHAMLVAVMMFGVAACTETAPLTGPGDERRIDTPPAVSGFNGAWAVTNWSRSTIEGGTTEIRGWAEELVLSYNVDLGNPGGGVTRRATSYQIVAPTTGTVQFTWEYTGFHAFFRSFADLRVQSGSATVVLVDNQVSSGSRFTFAGATSIAVTQGQPVMFRIAGENFDSNSRLRGELRLTGFRVIP